MKINIPASLSIMLMCLGGLFAANVSAASSSDWIRTDQSNLRLISERDGVAGRDSVRIGLQIKLAPGWKTYWRTPGDAGIPPHFDWVGSENLQLGICENICIPYEHAFTLALGAGTAKISKEAAIIDQYAKHVPAVIGTSGVAISRASAMALNDEDFRVTAYTNSSFDSPQIIIEGIEGAYFELLSKDVSQDRETANFILKANLPAKTDVLSSQQIVVTISDKGKAAQGPLHIE